MLQKKKKKKFLNFEKNTKDIFSCRGRSRNQKLFHTELRKWGTEEIFILESDLVLKILYPEVYSDNQTSKMELFLKKAWISEIDLGWIWVFSMQLLNMFYLLNDVKNRFFNENKKSFKQGYKSVNSAFIACSYLHYL